MSNAAELDPTFRNYSSGQAAAYDAHRGAPPSSILGEVFRFHTAKGGQFGTVLDVGCGTGRPTRALAKHFARATGTDPGEAMITQAQQVGGHTLSGAPVQYEVVASEELDKCKTVEPGSVDLLAAAMAAHWFRMAEFWPQAARMVKPGGTVALWTHSSLYCHPSTPNAAAVQKALSHLEDDILGPYELPSNHLSRTMYDTLVMPWALDPPVTAFPEAGAVRREWNRDGKLEPGVTDFFDENGEEVEESTLEELGQGLGTASMVTRWREAHPELVGTEQDCVALTMRSIAEALGVPPDADFSQVKLRLGSATALLLFTRVADKE